MIVKSIKDRFSVRKFLNKPVEKEKLKEILEAARLSPSARNTQPCHFVVISDPDKRAKLTEICNGQKFAAEAPLSIAVCADNTDYVMKCGQPAYTVDASIAAEHINLQAVELGLGSCWIGSFNHDALADLIKLPRDHKIVTLLPIGYPAVSKGERNLKSLEDLVSYNSFK
jgi:nitroreductase